MNETEVLALFAEAYRAVNNGRLCRIRRAMVARCLALLVGQDPEIAEMEAFNKE